MITRRFLSLAPDRLRLVGIGALAALVFVGCAASSGRLSWVTVLLVTGAFAGWCWEPVGWGPAGLWTGNALGWLIAHPGSSSYWSLPAALAALVEYAALTLAATGPESASIPAGVVHRWVGRVGVVAFATTVLALIGYFFVGHPPTGSAALTAAVSVLLGGTLLAMPWLTARDEAQVDPPG